MSDHPAASDLRPDAAFAGDRAAALGRTGRNLEELLAEYRRVEAAGASKATLDALLDELAMWTYRLLVQRESAGARSRNLESIQAAYGLPDAVLRRL